MFTSLKGLLNVNKQNSPDSNESTNINANAGAEVLSHYQEQWADLHENNENNARSIAHLSKQIITVQTRVNSQHENVAQVVSLLKSAPNLKDSIENCVVKLTHMYETFEKVETALITLEDLIENVEMEKKKIDHRYQFALYKEKKLANLEAARQKLAEKHAQNVINHELKQKKVLEERQQAFQDAFKTDLETYKSLGAIPKIEIPKNEPSALLEEIQLDLDKQELDQFLQDN